jgi:transposase
MKERRKRREFTDEFKTSVVKLYNNGKSRSELIREYDLTPSTVALWIKKYNDTLMLMITEVKKKKN